MKLRKHLVTALVIVGIAAGAGHFVQSSGTAPAEVETSSVLAGGVAASRNIAPMPKLDVPDGPPIVLVQDVTAIPFGLGVATESPAPATVTDTDARPVALFEETGTPFPTRPEATPAMPDEARMPDPLPLPEPSPLERLALTDLSQFPNAGAAAPGGATPALACDIAATAEEGTASMVHLTVAAPCNGNERITVRHSGLVFSAKTNALGSFTVDIPALRTDAQFTVTFADGQQATASVNVRLADQIERVVLQFNGKTGLQIHALEYGADYGEQGHVWADNARDPDLAMRLGGGFLTRLGDADLPDAFMAEIYTLPDSVTQNDGVIRLNVEAEVSADNCGKDIAGQTMQAHPDEEMRPVTLTLSMPDCDAVGEFLVLKNLLRDLKIAAN